MSMPRPKFLRGLLAAALLLAATGLSAAGTTTLKLINTASSGVSPAGMTLSATGSSLWGWQPTATLGATTTYWYDQAQNLSIPAGTWNVVLWTGAPGSSSVLRVDVLKTSASGASPVVLGTKSLDINTTGGGNHTSTFSMAIGAQTLSNQRIVVAVTRTSGANATVAFNGNDFASRLEYPTGSAPALAITQQPTNQSVAEGQSATFSVKAAALNGTTTYQWFKGTPASRVAIAGATSASYTTPILSYGDDGSLYHVIVKSPGAISLTSFNVKVTVLRRVTITKQPANATVKASQRATFSVTASSAAGVFTYQWYKGKAPGVAIAGATAASYTTPAAELIDNGNLYYVIVKGGTGFVSATSYNVKLTVLDNGLSITSQPANRTVTEGQAATFSVTAPGSGLGYQWYRASAGSTTHTAIAGATAASYTVASSTPADDWASFYVRVTNLSNGLYLDSARARLSVNPAVNFNYTIYPGFIGTELRNSTKGRWRDDQIFIAVFAEDANGAKTHISADGTVSLCAVADNDAPGHLTKNGQNYSNYGFSLAQTKLLKIPKCTGGRVFVSYGSPLYIKINGDESGNVGYAGPDPQAGNDPNAEIYYDWYEFSWASNALFINTTQVDIFGFPMTLDVYGDGRTFHKRVGITESRDSLFASFVQETPVEFHDLVGTYRMVAPCKGSFNEGRAHAHYLDSYIDEMWTKYASEPLVMDLWNASRRFSGRVIGQQMVFTEINLNNGAYVGGTYTVAGKPNTQEALEARGVLAQGNGTEAALEARIGACLSRHILEDASKWDQPSAWYLASPTNYWAKFWHAHSIDALSYAFSYDDVADQSTTVVCVSPEHMIFDLRW